MSAVLSFIICVNIFRMLSGLRVGFQVLVQYVQSCCIYPTTTHDLVLNLMLCANQLAQVQCKILTAAYGASYENKAECIAGRG